jgi:hypothetical protein
LGLGVVGSELSSKLTIGSDTYLHLGIQAWFLTVGQDANHANRMGVLRQQQVF